MSINAWLAGGGESVVRIFSDALSRSPDMAVAVAAIKALTEVVNSSQAQTMMGLEKDLKDAADSLIRYGLCKHSGQKTLGANCGSLIHPCARVL